MLQGPACSASGVHTPQTHESRRHNHHPSHQHASVVTTRLSTDDNVRLKRVFHQRDTGYEYLPNSLELSIELSNEVVDVGCYVAVSELAIFVKVVGNVVVFRHLVLLRTRACRIDGE